MNALNALRTAPVRLAVRLQTAGSGQSGDSGMTTAEYAVGTVAACGLGGVAVKVLTSEPVVAMFKQLITKAFHFGL